MSEELFRRMRELEEEGREIAFHRDEPDYVKKAREWIDKLRDVETEEIKLLDKFVHIEEPVRTEILNFTDYLRRARDFLDWDLMECQHRGVTRLRDCKISNMTAGHMANLDIMCKRITGERCVYLSTKPVTSSACVNDLTSCFHRFIEYLEKTIGKERIEEMGDKYIIMRDAGEREKKLLKIWLDAIKKLREKGFYYPADWKALMGEALKGKVELRVGSATGHRTHVDVEKNSLRYYDYDLSVNKEMHDLWEEYANCDCYIHSDGVSCEGCDLEKALMLLAGATSCDIRHKDMIKSGLSVKEAIERDKEDLVKVLSLKKKKKVEEKVIAGVEWITVRRDDVVIRMPKAWIKA